MTKKTPPAIEIIDPEMESIVDPNVEFEQIASGMQFTEGPVWLPRQQMFVYSDIPASKMYRWTKADGVSVFRDPSNNANGNTVDNEGRLLTCEHGSRRVTRTEHDGTITVLADQHKGGKLNSPNDVVVKKDNTIWFSDPPFGLNNRPKEQAGDHIFRLDPGATEPVPMDIDLVNPNGLCFSPDEQLLYIAEDDFAKQPRIRRFHVTKENTLTDDGVFTNITPFCPDGMRVDSAGRMFSTAGDGVQVFRADGTMIGKFLTPETTANCCFGGPGGKWFFMTAGTSVWRVALK